MHALCGINSESLTIIKQSMFIDRSPPCPASLYPICVQSEALRVERWRWQVSLYWSLTESIFSPLFAKMPLAFLENLTHFNYFLSYLVKYYWECPDRTIIVKPKTSNEVGLSLYSRPIEVKYLRLVKSFSLFHL